MARPNLSYLKKLILALFGLPCGCLTGMAAISNGPVIIPGLRFLLGQPPERAAQVALAATFAAGIGALLPYQQGGYISWKWVLPILVVQTLGGVWAQKALARGSVPAWTPKLGAGLILYLGGLLLYQETWIIAHGARSNVFSTTVAGNGANFIATMFIVSVVVGFVSGLIRIGGVLLLPALILALWMPVHLAQGTAIAVLVLAAAPVLLARSLRGGQDIGAAAWVPFGAFFGGLIGAHYITMFSETKTLITIGAGCYLVGLVTVMSKPVVLQPATVQGGDRERTAHSSESDKSDKSD